MGSRSVDCPGSACSDQRSSYGEDSSDWVLVAREEVVSAASETSAEDEDGVDVITTAVSSLRRRRLLRSATQWSSEDEMSSSRPWVSVSELLCEALSSLRLRAGGISHESVVRAVDLVLLVAVPAPPPGVSRNFVRVPWHEDRCRWLREDGPG